jgi:hypothetical protein
MRHIEHVVERLRAEYLAMPGLRLKPAQAQRLCGAERAACETALRALVTSKFLWVSADGHYARVPQRRAHGVVVEVGPPGRPDGPLGAAS